MKRVLLPLLVLLVLGACVKESTYDTLSENDSTTHLEIQEQTTDFTKTGNAPKKVDVCHNGNIINININAVPAHQGHGDAVDMDGDGYFDIANSCTAGVDCDDTDPAVNPGAEELCDDDIDNNCDGETNEGCIPDCTTECCFCDVFETFDPELACWALVPFDEGVYVYYIFTNGQNGDSSSGVAIGVFGDEAAVCATESSSEPISLEQAAICTDFMLEYVAAAGIPECGDDIFSLQGNPSINEIFKPRAGNE